MKQRQRKGRQQTKIKRQRVVVKLGSGLLTAESGGVDLDQIKSMGEQISFLHQQGYEVILVSSGAVSAGMTVLNLKKRPVDLAELQACATVGQPLLMASYQREFEIYGLCVAQILLTQWDLDSRKMYANARETVEHLLELGNCVPIVNENDALSFEEMEMLNRFGDNDALAGQVALLCDADELVILTSVDGLRTKSDGSGRLIRQVKRVDRRIEGYAGGSGSERSVGGMTSKVATGKLMLKNGIPMTIADGKVKDVLKKAFIERKVGTRFFREEKG